MNTAGGLNVAETVLVHSVCLVQLQLDQEADLLHSTSIAALLELHRAVSAHPSSSPQSLTPAVHPSLSLQSLTPVSHSSLLLQSLTSASHSSPSLQSHTPALHQPLTPVSLSSPVHQSLTPALHQPLTPSLSHPNSSLQLVSSPLQHHSLLKLVNSCWLGSSTVGG